MTSAVLGVQGTQTPWNRGRGIARYIAEHAAALLDAGVADAIHIDPDLPEPTLGAGFPASVARIDGPLAVGGSLYHVMSPFEELIIDRVWPVWARRPDVALVVTIYDLIPLADPDSYLVNAPLRAYYTTREELLAAADIVVAISGASASEAVARAGLSPSRVHTISTGCSEGFSPAAPGEDSLAAVRSRLPRLKDRFILYVGGLDPRKNVERLVTGFAGLPSAVRARAQLVVASPPEPHREREVRALCARLGVASDVVLTGFVDDEMLITLYRACRAHVLPSLSEGFGLPVVEAMRCGAASLVSDIPVLAELVPEAEARFNPYSTREISGALRRVIEDDDFVERLRRRAPSLAAPHTWQRVAAATAAAYDAARQRRSEITRSRKAS